MSDTQKLQNPQLQRLLEPLAGANPCGPDLWLSEGRFRLQQPLEEAIKSDQDPNWNATLDNATQILEQSRDLRVAVVLCLALFRVEGLPGFCDGIMLIRGLVEKFWDHLHPLPEGPDDPARGNVLGNLSAPLGTGSAYKFIKLLRQAPLCKSPSGTAISLADIDRADSGDPKTKPVMTREQIDAAFKETREQLNQTCGMLAGVMLQVVAIEDFISSKAGRDAKPDFDDLKKILQRMIAEIKEPESKAQPKEGKVAEASGQSGQGPARPGAVIGSRADVEAALAAVCDYFHRWEPSSPVPLLIERARKLLKLDFIESVRELAPDSVGKFHPLFGTKDPPKSENEAKKQ